MATRKAGAKSPTSKGAAAPKGTTAKPRKPAAPKVEAKAEVQLPQEVKQGFANAKAWVNKHAPGYFACVTVDGAPILYFGSTDEKEARAWMDNDYLANEFDRYVKQGKTVIFSMAGGVELPDNNSFVTVKDAQVLQQLDPENVVAITSMTDTVAVAKSAKRAGAAKKRAIAQKRSAASKKRTTTRKRSR